MIEENKNKVYGNCAICNRILKGQYYLSPTGEEKICEYCLFTEQMKRAERRTAQ